MEKFIPYGRHNITEDDINAVTKVLKSSRITQGPVIELFENALSKRVRSKYSLTTNSATSALHIACLALGLEEGDWVWSSPTTFVASLNCALYCRAKVSFIDIDKETGLISIEALKKKLLSAAKNGTLPKIIIPVHLAGSSCDMREIAKLSATYKFRIIEDASHAVGGFYENEPVGNCKFSDITVFSFHPVKIITTGEGGIATTNNEELYNSMKMLRSHGITKEKHFFKYPIKGPWSYEQQLLGFNYRMTEIQAALGFSQLKRLDKIIEERNRIYEKYIFLLKSLPLEPLKIPRNCKSSLHLFVIRLHNKEPNFHRKVFEELISKNIGVQLHYLPVHLQPYFRKLGFKENDYPEAESYATNAISLPIFPGLLENEILHVFSTLKNFLN